MNNLSGQKVKQLQQILLQAYDHNSLAQMVRFELDGHLDTIAEGGTFADRVFNLIIWAERQGRLRNLLEGAKAGNPQNAQLQEFVGSLLREIAPTPVPTSSPRRLQTPVAFDWCHVPAGPFYMGSTPQQIEQIFELGQEGPQKLQYVDEYSITRTPITNAQFAQFTSTTGYTTTAEKSGSEQTWQHPTGPNSTAKMDHPVVCVSWHDALAFCDWAGVKLPSEVQWEKAARGDDARIYPWGDDVPNEEHCNFNRNVGTTTAVGKYPNGVSLYGCLDMAGNVWEWTSSLYKPYPYDANDGREDLEDSGTRMLRGGSCNVNDNYVRCAVRFYFDPTVDNYDIGFRVMSPGS